MYFVVTSPVVMLQNGINYSLIEIKTISFGMSELLVISVSHICFVWSSWKAPVRELHSSE